MLTIADVLSIRHPEPPRWSRDSRWLAFHYDVDGLRELWAVPATGGGALRASGAGEKAGPFDWAPDGRLVYACGGRVCAVQPSGGPAGSGSSAGPDLLLEGPEPVTALKWSPDGQTLAVVRGGVLSLLGVAGPGAGPLLRDLALPGKVTDLHWSPDSTRVGCLTLCGNQRDAAAVEASTGRVLWRSDNPDWEHGLAWAGSDRLSLARMTMDSTLREFLLIDVTTGAERLVERESSHKGLRPEVTPVPSPQGDAIAYTWLVDGWPHVVLYEVATGERRLLLSGAHEDVGHAFDRPAWSPDGRYLAFASNKGNLQQRQLWRFDRQTGEMRQLTDLAGTNVSPAWAPDGGQIAYIACSPYHSAEVAVMAADGAGARLLTRSMPEAWSREAVTPPQHITYPGLGGLEVHADLFLPKGFDPTRKYPALVYVHGGPMRQMRYGWHPLHAYAVFYTFNQFLLHQGYVILSVDYRGGIGYGVEYEQANYLQFGQGEMDDCSRGAEYLKQLPYVDGDAVGIWGLSYGGYMTLACLTKRPDLFALGINIAGVWDQEQWARWRAQKDPGIPLYFVQRWGGPKNAENAEAYRQISPRHFVQGLRAPLLNLHGTADEAVDFAQLDQIVRDCVEHGKDFAAVHYPDETHMFTKRKTWEDAFGRMTAAFERYLKAEPGARPRAMI